jgi:hypothetical protein
MRIGSSFVLIAVGAILKFAVPASDSGANLPVVGVVLMVVGIVAVVLSLILASTVRRTQVCASNSSCGPCGATAG